MLSDLTERLRDDADAFHAADPESFTEEIPNVQAFLYLKQNAPLAGLSRQRTGKTYYFR